MKYRKSKDEYGARREFLELLEKQEGWAHYDQLEEYGLLITMELDNAIHHEGYKCYYQIKEWFRFYKRKLPYAYHDKDEVICILGWELEEAKLNNKYLRGIK